MTLEQLIESARGKKLSAQEREEQRISFAYGNSAEKDHSTFDSVRAASTYLKEHQKR